MQLARVIGDIVATRKEPALEGVKLLVVQPLAVDGQDAGRPIVAVDSVGAGVGERVFFVRGKEASFPFYPTEVPADAGIVGIVDHWSTVDNHAGPPAGGGIRRADSSPATRPPRRDGI
jgi:ethanolamine utilization protein EutN